jgi:hypothetical protein
VGGLATGTEPVDKPGGAGGDTIGLPEPSLHKTYFCDMRRRIIGNPVEHVRRPDAESGRKRNFDIIRDPC